MKKLCGSCKKEKELSEFYKANNGRGDGHQYECKQCTRTRLKGFVRDPIKVKESSLKTRIKNREKILMRMRATRRSWKIEMLNAYSDNNPLCVCCGDTHIEFLCLDHINGGGNKERKIHGGTMGLRKYLRKNNYPPGYRVLCQNCNSSIGSFGYCPHKNI